MEQNNEKMDDVEAQVAPSPVSDTDILSSPQKAMNPFAYFFISFGKFFAKIGLWLLDLILSIFLSLWHFIKTVGIGCYKFVLGVGRFFQKKAFEFSHNDWAGRMSYLIWGTSSFRNKQYFNGVLYIVFEVVYTMFFALNGAHSIYMLGSLGVVQSGPDPTCDDTICPYINGDNSIMILIYGLLWVLSLLLFFYIWNRSIESGYTNYRINQFLKYENVIEKTIPLSRKLDQDAVEAYANKQSKREFYAAHKDEIDAFTNTFEDPKAKSYAAYLLKNTCTVSYEHLAKAAKAKARLQKLEQQKAAALTKRDEGYQALLAKKPADNEEAVAAFGEKVERYQVKTTNVEVNWGHKIDKQNNVLAEIEKQYLCYAEQESVKNNNLYGRYNEYYSHLTKLRNKETLYEHYEDLVAVYQDRYGKAKEKNEDNAKELVKLEQEYQEKLKETATKFQGMRERKAALNQELAKVKADSRAEMKAIQAKNDPDKEEQLAKAKDNLVDNVTRIMRSLHDFPDDKAIKAMEKEENQESRSAYRRDKKYLKTNYTDASYAAEEVLNELIVAYNLPYAEAKAAAHEILKKENGKVSFLSQEEVTARLAEVRAAEQDYQEKHPEQYQGRPKRFKETWNTLLNEKFYITMLTIPVLGTLFITVVPLLFSILVAFTNYSSGHTPPTQLFTWIGWGNFQNLFNPAPDSVYAALPNALLHTVGWTLLWAVLATFTNYFLGIVVALLINKKSIKLKKLWRGIFVTTIAIPQFISLLSIGVLLKDSGALGTWWWQTTGSRLGFATDTSTTGVFWTRFIIVCVNVWVGIPYTILSTTGILLNIPDDLYESARVDGANAWTQFWRITMPYILFVTGPYLITQFIGNINNFNVIYFLSGGGPALVGSGLLGLGQTDLLITFLYKTVTSNSNPQYGIASAVGIIVFILCSFISIVMYNKSGAVREEDQFQ